MYSSQVIYGCGITFLFFSPKGQVFFKKFDDALGVTEVVFLELVNLLEGFLESLVGKLASLTMVLHHFVVEHREVESETELDRVACGEVDIVGGVVCLEGRLLDTFELGISRVLANVTIVVTDHLYEEGLGLSFALLAQHLVLDDGDDALAVGDELLLNLALVDEQSFVVLGILGVLLNCSDGSASGTLGRNEVLESNRDEVALVRVHFGALDFKDLLKEGDHVIEALGLFCDTGKENVFFNGGHLFDFRN